MFKDFDVNIIDKYLHEKFPIIFDFKFDGLILLLGGTIKDLMMGKKESKDLDFVLLTQGKGNLNDFIKKYNIEALTLTDSGCKLRYKGMIIDIHIHNDLYDAGCLSTDYLFYDINRKTLIPIGIRQSIKNNTVYEYCYREYYHTKKRLKKVKKFIMYFNNKKRVKTKYCYNRLYQLFLAFLRNPQKIFKKN